MMPDELKKLIEQVSRERFETQNIELKAAEKGCPEKLYDTLSSFSNQDGGGIIIFGINEGKDFAMTGVYDVQDLQKHVTEQCNQMEPKVRAIFTVAEKNGKQFVAAEIPGIDVNERPCFYSGKGRLRGSYRRVGDADEPMTEYEIYSYEAFRKKYEDDIRTANADRTVLDEAAVGMFLALLKKDKPNLQMLSDKQIETLMGLIKDEKPTVYAVLIFGIYPQAVYPQLSIIATVVPGEEMGETGTDGERFADNKRIEGTLPQMIDEAVAFVMRNMKQKTIITETEIGIRRKDVYEYPVTAVREAVINAVIHRDYSIHTEGMPITLTMYSDRLVIENPGGLYGRLSIDGLGKVQPDTRNPKIAVAMELLGMTENRYSGIPTIYREMKNAGLPEPIFSDRRGCFSVCFMKKKTMEKTTDSREEKLLAFCTEYRTKEEIAGFLGIATADYAVKKYIQPLIAQGLLKTEKPGKRSHNQRYIAVSSVAP